jgi:hypothetical protein
MTSETVDPLSRLGRSLIQHVRDRAIQECDRLASGQSVGPDGQRWDGVLSSDQSRSAVAALIPDIVDQTMFQLLHALDNELVPLAFRHADGSIVPLNAVGMGEMGGWYMGSPGWRHEFSNERFFDPLSGLRLKLDEPNTP